MTKKRTDAEMFDAILDLADLDVVLDALTDDELRTKLEKAGYTKEKLEEFIKKRSPRHRA